MTKDPTPDPSEDEDNPAFLTYLEKNLPWLKEKLLPSSNDPTPKPGQSDPIAKFFETALSETKAEMKALATQAEQMRDLLNPEQLAQLKLLRSAGAADPGKALPTAKPSDPSPVDQPKPKKRFL